MTATNNFCQHNPTAVNQDTDATFATDAVRENGFTPDALVPHGPFQKELYQVTTWVAAAALALENAGFTCLDGSPSPDPGLVTPSASVTALADVLANYITTANFNGSISLSANGYIKLPSLLGGLIIQWGTQSYGGGGASANPLPAQTFPTPFLTAVFTMVASSNSVSTNMVWLAATSLTTSGFTLSFSTGGESANAFTARWVAIGY